MSKKPVATFLKLILSFVSITGYMLVFAINENGVSAMTKILKVD